MGDEALQLRPYVVGSISWDGNAIAMEFVAAEERRGKRRPSSTRALNGGPAEPDVVSYVDDAYHWPTRQSAEKWLGKQHAKGVAGGLKLFNLLRLDMSPDQLRDALHNNDLPDYGR